MKKNYLKRSFVTLTAVAMLFLSGMSLPETVAATEAQNYSQGSYDVVDDGNLLSEEEKAAVMDTLKELAEASNWSVFAITTCDTGGKTSEEYADAFVDSRAFEQDGVCFLIDMDNRQAYLSTTGLAIRYLTDDRIDSITETGAGYCGNSAYGDCFLYMIRSTLKVYNQGIYDDQYNQDTDSFWNEKDYYNENMQEDYRASIRNRIILSLVFGLIAAAATAAIFIGVVVGKYRFNFDKYKYDYSKNCNLSFTRQEDILTGTHVTHHHISTDNGSSGHHSSSGHRSSTHHSSGGGHHGGGGHGF